VQEKPFQETKYCHCLGDPLGVDGVHLILFLSFNELARLGNEVQAELKGFLVRGKEGSVEDAMHLPGQRESKAIGVRGDNLGDFERAFSSRGQFSGREVNLQVKRVKPDLCSYFPGGELHSNPFFDSLSCLSVGGGSLFASSIEDFELFIESREECLSNQRVGSGLKAHHERERCFVGNRVGGGVM